MRFSPLKKLLLIFLALGAVGAGLLAVLWLTSPNQLGRAAFAATGLPERTLAEAQALAREQNKPLLMDFSAYWCGVCRRLDRTVMIDERVKARIEEKYVFVRLDSEHPDTRPLMGKYGIYGFPTLIVAHADGRPIKFVPLAFEPEKFLQAL